ncbi:PREDICTED: NSFL1 cofactor p47 [Nicrophorus vespilloides]|uniref:NSFL1 cofactor p47 n=1 Tax=Nicrophorus vespilloides TaxID=110193 RepID=A0ABM1MQE7_NICVS|nr:PREDICTED: NSFL1 cofactor p47 [Nicrophorus vespilloides]
MSGNDEKIEHFRSITGVNEERARFYLEAASWTLEMALASFYDADADSQSDVEVIDQPSDTEPTTPLAKPKPEKKKVNSKFATIHTLNNSSDEEEDGQAFYAGGSEHSGQQVLGPKKKDIVADMFKSVKEHGVEVLDNQASGSSAFRGTGYKLGQTSDDTETVPGAPVPSKPVQVTLKLWKEGFSIDDGALRMYTDPANQEFLTSVRRGEIPTELRRDVSEVHVSMEDHRMETFAKKSERFSRKAFSGQGHTLGSPTPPTIGAPLDEDRNVNESHARENLHVDSNQPTTNLQIRLADGTRLVGQFNHQHTIEQIRSFIVTARPQYEMRSFALLTSFPPKELQDKQTIVDAGILNSAIIQKLT